MTEQTNTPSDVAAKPDAQRQPGGQVVVRYGRMMQLGLFDYDPAATPAPGTKLVIHTERGTELGTVVIGVSSGDSPWEIGDEQLRQYLADSGKNYPFTRGGKVVRLANRQDINDQCHLEKSAAAEAGFCREQIKALALDMRLVAVEHILGGERAVFFFTSETRVDFRELVQRLAKQYHTRIEMRQIGARDEARLLADYERCGRQCCCREYLKLLKPVSMRMAKVQKATLDPCKISGRCGRLMCCLRYEDKTYEELIRKLPKRNTWARTSGGVVGRVLETQIITQLVRLEQVDKRQVVVSNEEIVDRGMTSPPATPVPAKPAETGRPADQPAKSEAGSPPDGKPVAAQPDASAQRPRSGSRRRSRSRRKEKNPRHPGALSAAPQVNHDSQAGQRGKKKRRRRKPKGDKPESGD